jgi:hypothetical protein
LSWNAWNEQYEMTVRAMQQSLNERPRLATFAEIWQCTLKTFGDKTPITPEKTKILSPGSCMSLLPRRKSFLRNRNRAVNVARAVLRFSAKAMDNDDNIMDNDDSADASDVKETTSSSLLLSPLYTAVRVCVDKQLVAYLFVAISWCGTKRTTISHSNVGQVLTRRVACQGVQSILL